MHRGNIVLAVIFLAGLSVTGARANETEATCNIEDARLEEAILQKPEFHGPGNRQMIRDLRALRDAAFILWSYGRHEDCDRLLANIRELIAVPTMSALGGNDEEDAREQFAAREPILQRGGAEIGRRGDSDAVPLISINELAPGLLADQIIGMEVRSSDDKIIGEVRNIVFGTKDRWDYAIVASGGFFTIGKDSIVVPIRYLKVSQDRYSFYLPISEEAAKNVPLMPDQNYDWLSDSEWRARNDAIFE
ncbi:MAG TPA: PRC-barrel domain-containing protein [Saliniramus sp.]|nr:PRC-barrel domain-containing protein [Saliniramus sp.]